MNGVKIKCCKCKQEFMISSDELMIFENGICHKCIDPRVRHIRNKIVYGFYDLPEITDEIVAKLVDKEFSNNANKDTEFI